MSISSFDWLGAHLPLGSTVYSVIMLAIYLGGFGALGYSAFDAWRDRRASRGKDAEEGDDVVADARWGGTFQRWLAMTLLVLVGALGLFAANPDALPVNVRRATGLVLIAAVVGLFVNAERVYWRQRARFAELVRRRMRGDPPL